MYNYSRYETSKKTNNFLLRIFQELQSEDSHRNYTVVYSLFVGVEGC